MAHNIEIVDGEASMVYAGETPWHGLGTEISPDLSPKKVMQKAKLNWGVEKVPLIYSYKDLVSQASSGQNALVRDRDGKMLDVVPDNWNPIQNADAFEFFDRYVKAGAMKMHTAGSLDGGRIVWALAKLEQDFEVFGGDVIESHVLFTNPHIYGRTADIRSTPTRVVCQNTLTLALSKRSDLMLKISHRNEFDVEEVQRVVERQKELLKDYKENAEFLGSRRYTQENAQIYLDTLFPNESKAAKDDDEFKLSRPAQQIFDLLETQPGAQYAAGSYWQLFNGVTFAIDHLLGHSQESRLKSAWYGFNRDRKLKALKLAVNMANAS